jgi:hypothetical protein
MRRARRRDPRWRQSTRQTVVDFTVGEGIVDDGAGFCISKVQEFRISPEYMLRLRSHPCALLRVILGSAFPKQL